MATPPWLIASPSHCNTNYIANKFNKNITSQNYSHSHSHSHSPLQEQVIIICKRNVYCSHQNYQLLHSAFFNIKMNNGMRTIAFYVQYFNDKILHSNVDTTKNQLQISPNTSTSLNHLTAHMTPISSTYKNFSIITHEHDDSNHITCSNISLLNTPPQPTTRHSPVIKIIAQVHK